jgi:hypothetical protein
MIKSSPWKVNKIEFQSPDGNLVLNPFVSALISSEIPIMANIIPKTKKSLDKKVEVLKTLILVMVV